jgi:hypothetical protein
MALRNLREVAVGVTLTTAAVLASCGGSDLTEPTSDGISGLYVLRTLNGTAVPFLLPVGTDTLELTWGGITLTDNAIDGGSFKIAFVDHWSGTLELRTETFSGTYARLGTELTFGGDSTAGTWVGTVDGGQITMYVGPPVIVNPGRSIPVQAVPPVVEVGNLQVWVFRK